MQSFPNLPDNNYFCFKAWGPKSLICVLLTQPCALALCCLQLEEKGLWLLQEGAGQPARFVSTSPHPCVAGGGREEGGLFLVLTQRPSYQLTAPSSGPSALTSCSVISPRLPEKGLAALGT